MAESSIFPAFIRAEYDPSGNGFPLFEKEAGAAADRARRSFEANFSQVQRVIHSALSGGLKTSGALDLGVSGFRQAAAEARAYEASARTTRDAAIRLAEATGDTSQSTQSYIQVLRAQVIEAKSSRQEAEAQVATYTRLQAEIDATASRNSALVATYRELYAEQARAARDEVGARRSQAGYDQLLNLSRPAATANGAGFEALDQYARNMERLGVAATQLHAQLDPMYAAQQRFNQALDTADDLLKANIIDERLHADAVQNARDQLRSHSDAIHSQVDGFQKLTRGSGILRQAYVQTGQQLQDVTISLIGGQKASVVFAQQLPQLAFALSGLGMQADGTQRGIGRIATLLSGPWGVAFTGAAFAVGLLVEKLWQTDDVTKKAADSFDTFGDAQSKLAKVIDLTTGAMASQNIVLREAIRLEAIKDKRDADKALEKGRESLAQLRTRSNTTSSLSAVGGGGSAMSVGGFREDVDPSTQRRLSGLLDRYVSGNLTETQVRRGIDYLSEKKLLGDLDPISVLEQVLEVGKSRNKGAAAQGIIDAIDGKGLPDWARKTTSTSPTARLNAQARLDAADTPLEVARAELALEKAKSGELLKQGKITENQYLANVRAKEVEVQRQQGLKEATAQGEKAARAYQRLLDFGQQAAETIQRISERFDDQPKLIDQAAQATRKLDDIISDLASRQPPGFKEMIADAERAKDVVANGLTKPYRDLIRQMDEDVSIGQLIVDGRQAEADALRAILALKERTGQVDAQQVREIAKRTVELEKQQRLMEKLRDQQQPYLNALGDIRSSITDTFASFRTEGIGALGDFVDRFRRTFDNLASEVLTESLFGDIFRELEDSVTGRKKDIRTDEINSALLGTAAKAEQLGNALAAAANKAAGTTVANDNETAAQEAYADIVVTARKAMQEPVSFLSTSMTKLFEKVLPKDLAKDVGKYVGEAVQGAAYGQMAGGLLLGGANSKIGSSIGGALGNVVGKELGTKLGSTLGKFAGALGPLGSIAGGLLGGAVGSLFKTAKWGTAAVVGQGEGDVTVGGNKSAYRSNANLAGTSIQSGLASIAEQLGADIGGYNVSIGQYKGKWRVSSTGRTGKLKGKYSDVTDFGKEGAEDAIKFAISDAVRDGALLGLRASTQALLANSDDIESQLQKALDFESVFQRLKEYKDPVGAAMDTLDKEFKRLKDIFEEAGASAEEYAQLEELYGIERAAAVKEAAEKVTASLKSLFDELTVGNDARSLRERLVEAQAAYNPLAQRVAAGDTTAYDDYSDAARTLLDLQRQVYGSSEDYFKLLDQITALTKTRIDAETSVAEASANRESLFATDTALAPVVSATEAQTTALTTAFTQGLSALGIKLDALNDNFISIYRANGSNSKLMEALITTRGNF
jgi:hypothetical protein